MVRARVRAAGRGRAFKTDDVSSSAGLINVSREKTEMSEGKKARAKPPPIHIGGSEAQASDSPDGGFISGVGSSIE